MIFVSLLINVAITPLIVVVAATVPQKVAEADLTLRFCYEDKQLLPFFAGDSVTVPEHPGATIEHLQRATTAVGISLELVRMPWLRCLQQLAEGKVDALVAAYYANRAHFTMYPQDQFGRPDPSRAINSNALCLTYRFDNDLPAKLKNENAELTIARPLGYQALPLPPHARLVSAHSPENALELVVSGRVDSTTVTCEINGLVANRQEIDTLPLKVLQPPVYYSVGYLMLSKPFYLKNPEVADKLWRALPLYIDHNRYVDYLAYPLGF
ncbi:amino acid ABC transporter [Arsukibacterium sp.]|uniref:amino acid ABC transporter n=1 Tax=Arsukibacterium sp. TaxID=1977258 RepID=UPI00356AE8B1